MTQMPDSLVAPGHVYHQECRLACRSSGWAGLLLSLTLSVFSLSVYFSFIFVVLFSEGFICLSRFMRLVFEFRAGTWLRGSPSFTLETLHGNKLRPAAMKLL